GDSNTLSSRLDATSRGSFAASALAALDGREACLLRRLAPHHAIPPGADARRGLVIAFDHIHRLAQAGRGGLDADRARLGPLFRRHPQTVVAPHARAPGDLFRLPAVDVNDAAAPAVLHHESRRRI